MKVDPNAPAFPESYIGNERPHEGIGDGLTVRAYFAAKAMQGMAAGAAWTEHFDRHDKYAMAVACAVAVCAADALIAELNKENSND